MCETKNKITQFGFTIYFNDSFFLTPQAIEKAEESSSKLCPVFYLFFSIIPEKNTNDNFFFKNCNQPF